VEEWPILGWHQNTRGLQTTRRPTTQSALPSQGHWNRLQEGGQLPTAGHNIHRWPSCNQTNELGGARPSQKYALQAGRHIVSLRKARPGIVIEIRWCPAHKGVTGNEKAGEWAKIAAEEPGARGVQWLNYADRTEARAMPLPRSLANFKREKKWADADLKTKHKLPKSQKPDGTIAESQEARLKYYQLKTGHARTGQCLRWTGVRPAARYWCCQCPSQTGDHLFEVCPGWRMQRGILWAKVRKETGRWKSR